MVVDFVCAAMEFHWLLDCCCCCFRALGSRVKLPAVTFVALWIFSWVAGPPEVQKKQTEMKKEKKTKINIYYVLTS